MRSPAMTEIPLSFPQQLLRFFEMLRPGSFHDGGFNVVGRYRVHGPVDEELLGWAAGRLVERHDALRTVVHLGPGVPHQTCVDVPSPALDIVTGSPAVTEFFDEAERMVLDPQHPPLVALRLATAPGDSALLAITVHHSVADHWSLGILLRDLSELYLARRSRDSLPARPRQYGEFSRAQEFGSSDRHIGEDLRFWKRTLRGLTLGAVPTDRPRSDQSRFDKAQLSVDLTPEVTANFLNRARATRTTPFIAFFTAYVTALAEVSGNHDVAVPVLTSGRDDPGFDDTVGFFLNCLIIRATVDGGAPTGDSVPAVRRACLAAYSHQRAPILRVIDAIDEVALLLADRDYPLMPFQFLALPPALEQPTFAGWTCERIAPDHARAQLTLPLDGLTTAELLPDGGTTIKIVFSGALYETATMRAFAAVLRRRLHECASFSPTSSERS